MLVRVREVEDEGLQEEEDQRGLDLRYDDGPVERGHGLARITGEACCSKTWRSTWRWSTEAAAHVVWKGIAGESWRAVGTARRPQPRCKQFRDRIQHYAWGKSRR